MAHRLARLLCAAAFLSVPAAAQEVRGRAMSPGATAPMSGVIVTLVDSVGVVVDRALSSEVGAFRLRAARPAT